MKKLIIVLCLTAAISSSPFAAWSQGAETATSITGNEKDGKILSDVMAANNYTLLLMKIAIQKAQTQELRSAAGSMLVDHQRMDAQLTALANRLNFGMDAEKRAKYTSKLSKWDKDEAMAGWDKDVIEELVDMHKDGIDMLEDAQTSVKDAELKKQIVDAIPVMRSHLDVLIPMKGKIKDGDGTTATTAPIANTDVASEMRAGNEEDAKFFSDLRLNNVYELKLMEMVFKKSGNRNLKNAAQQMMEDHQKLEQRTREYGTRMKFGLDPDEGGKVNEKLSKWNGKKGGMEWDADIMEELVDLHKDGVDMLEDSQSDVKDAELKALISGALSMEQKHREMVSRLKETVKKPWKGK